MILFFGSKIKCFCGKSEFFLRFFRYNFFIILPTATSTVNIFALAAGLTH